MKAVDTQVLRAEVLIKKVLIGILAKHFEGEKIYYTFQYDKDYCLDEARKPLVPNMPKATDIYYSDYLFPIFFGLLSEGNAKEYQCKYYKIDPEDHFALLLKTCRYNTLFGICIKEIKAKKNKK